MNSKLTTILRRYVEPGMPGGAARPVDRESLRKDLEDLRAGMNLKHWVIIAMILLVFAFEFFLAIKYYDSPRVLAGVAGGCGITLAGAIAAMSTVSRQSARLGVLVILAREVEPSQLPQIMKLLLEKLAS